MIERMSRMEGVDTGVRHHAEAAIDIGRIFAKHASRLFAAHLINAIFRKNRVDRVAEALAQRLLVQRDRVVDVAFARVRDHHPIDHGEHIEDGDGVAH